MMCIIPHYRHNVTASHEHQYSNDQLSQHSRRTQLRNISCRAAPCHESIKKLIHFLQQQQHMYTTLFTQAMQCVCVCSGDMGVELFHQAVEYKACRLNLTPAVLGLD